ncbi:MULTISPECIES: secondary thiamine-phosphate synthase enzyme YjbQ [Salinibacter]|jgi:secondary thiamine-phosphate synthase enzyme|uniref:secondary thiamine-phosphate synthase enzyme YjbQ n=1 Tax=Salinibacter TaxID=146918 RepID=UPI001ABB1965|nr:MULTISPECIES: secondary thiamine-phosphate synthase enzyme YjbQ [Salinibacter]
MEWRQDTVRLAPKSRGFHLVTDEVLGQGPRIDDLRVGLLHLFIQHTSASLTINENAAPAVRGDMERHFNEMVPENQPHYQHTVEGPDDMPAHIKASMLDTSLSVPIQDGQPAFGTWQGIYLNEHRDHGGARSVVVTIRGETT